MAAPPARIPALDGLRGAAVCLIVLFHAFPRWFPGGFLGVDLFLVLSGMLIVDGLLAERARTGRLAIARFLARRALRLGPALLVLLAVYLAYAALTGGAVDAALMDAALVLGGVANWSLALGFERPGLLAHGWSLAVEQQFYLVCPGLVLLLSHRRLRAAAPVLLIVMIVALAAWRAHLAADGASAMRLFTGLDTRGGALLAGAALGFLGRAPAAAGQEAALARLALLVVALLLPAVAFVDWTHPALYEGGFEAAALGAVILVAACRSPRSSWTRRLFELRPLVALGTISYGVYLWHFPLIWIVAGDPTVAAPAVLAAALAASVALALMSYHGLERPLQAWYRRARPTSRAIVLPDGLRVRPSAG